MLLIRANVIDLGFIFFGFKDIRFDQDLKRILNWLKFF